MPWRKLQAGLSGKGEAKDLMAAVQHIQDNTISLPSVADDGTFNNLTAIRTFRSPFGTDKYRETGSAALYEFQNDTSSPSYCFGVNWDAQTFTPSVTHTLKAISLNVGRVGVPGNVVVSIKATSGGEPTGDDLATSTVSGNPWPLSVTPAWLAEWVVFNMVPNIELESSTQYAIVIRNTGGDTSNRIVYKFDATGAYTGGARFDSVNSGVSWTEQVGEDIAFKDWGADNYAGFLWQEDTSMHAFDESGLERIYLHEDNIGIADGDIVKVDGSAVDNDYAKFTSDGLEGRTYNEVLDDLFGIVEIVNTDSPYAAVDKKIIIADASSGAVTVELPAISGIAGRRYYIKCIDDTNTMTVDGDGETIDGFATKTLNKNDCMVVVATSVEYSII